MKRFYARAKNLANFADVFFFAVALMTSTLRLPFPCFLFCFELRSIKHLMTGLKETASSFPPRLSMLLSALDSVKIEGLQEKKKKPLFPFGPCALGNQWYTFKTSWLQTIHNTLKHVENKNTLLHLHHSRLVGYPSRCDPWWFCAHILYHSGNFPRAGLLPVSSQWNILYTHLSQSVQSLSVCVCVCVRFWENHSKSHQMSHPNRTEIAASLHLRQKLHWRARQLKIT